jgi:hypothetical protein
MLIDVVIQVASRRKAFPPQRCFQFPDLPLGALFVPPNEIAKSESYWIECVIEKHRKLRASRSCANLLSSAMRPVVDRGPMLGLLRLLEIAQIRRRLVFLRPHQLAVRAAEIVLVLAAPDGAAKSAIAKATAQIEIR